MKYKDLQVGDWFTIYDDPNPYIRVKTSDGYLYDLYLGDDFVGFGCCLLKRNTPDLEVHFLNELNVVNPYFSKNASLDAKYPLCQFFQMDVIAGEPLILFTAYVDGENCGMFLNGANYTGVLDKSLLISNKVNAKVIPDISILFPEKEY